jgi:hypothetical protein
MEPFPFTEQDWAAVSSAAIAVAQAGLADDDVLRQSALLDLEELITSLSGKYGEHPVLLETLADFESDPERQVTLYRRALQQAERFGLPTVTIRLALARVLLEELQNPVEAGEVLMDGESELAGHEDAGDIESWSSLKQEMRCDHETRSRIGRHSTNA